MLKSILSTLLALYTVILSAQERVPLSSTVQMYKGRPVIMLNGKPEYPAIYSLTDVPGGRWSWEELPSYNMKSFCSRGFKLIQVDIFLDHVWKEDGSIVMDTVQRQLRGVLNNCPDAAIFIRFHVNPPKWWQKKNPQENTIYADTKAKPDYTWSVQRIIEDDEETPERFSLASTKWIDEASTKTKEFLKKLQSMPEGNALAGIQVASGVYGEWHYWGFINNEPDMSKPMLLYFQKWLKEKYKSDAALKKAWNDPAVTLSTATLPTLVERRTTQAGIFRNPLKERKIIDYYEAQHTCVADDILHFCKLVKENWPRPIITGAFYGYFYAVFGREAAGGHLELQRVLNSPDIDFLSGPGTYYPDAVAPGDAYRSRSLINSVLLHNKLWLDEMDQQAPLLTLKDSAFNESVQKSIATVRRNFLFTSSKGMGLWFYDFGPSGFNGGKRLNDHGSWGWWDEPSLMEDIKALKKIADTSLEVPYTTNADVLLVHDTKTFYYTASSKPDNHMGHWANNWIPPAIFKSGVVHDVIHVDDLERIKIDQYKAVVFVNTCVLNEKQKTIIASKIAKGNRHIIFTYAPGYSDEKKLDKKFIESVTGIKLSQFYSTKPITMIMSKDIIGVANTSTWNNALNPLFSVSDDKATTLGTIKDSTAVLFARKSFSDHTSWFMSLPSGDPNLWRFIFQNTGVHVYETKGDVIYSGGTILTIHTASGGERRIVLRNGKIISVKLKANSTLLLHTETGEVILE